MTIYNARILARLRIEKLIKELENAGFNCRCIDVNKYEQEIGRRSKNLCKHSGSHTSKIAEMHEAIVNLLEIGKRDLTNPKYDGYFTALQNVVGDARCNFCNCPMPCFCDKPEGWRDPTETEIKRNQK